MLRVLHGHVAVALCGGLVLGAWPVTSEAKFTTIYSFSGPDGAYPNDLTITAGGVIYGTTLAGGTCAPTTVGCGTVFRLTPPAPGQTNWTHTILYSFTGLKDGDNPHGGVIFGRDGELYGTTDNNQTSGGLFGYGVVFKLQPPAAGGVPWIETVLHTFPATQHDGEDPVSNLLIDATGALYGVTKGGGCCTLEGGGVAYKLTPPTSRGGAWTETILHIFASYASDARAPNGGLIADANGNIYGTTDGTTPDLTFGGGTIYRLSPPSTVEGQWTETILYTFDVTKKDGSYPRGPLVFGQCDNLYGVTATNGDTEGSYTAGGTLFHLAPPRSSGAPWTLDRLYSFSQPGDLAYPDDGLIWSHSTLFGLASSNGSASAQAKLFAFAHPNPTHTAWTENVIHTFNADESVSLVSRLSRDVVGNVYGVTGTFIDPGVYNYPTFGVPACHAGTAPGPVTSRSCGSIFMVTP